MTETATKPASSWKATVRAVLIATSAFALFANATTTLSPEYNRMVHWGLMAFVALLVFGRSRTSPGPRAIDIALAALVVASTVFLVWDYQAYVQRTGIVTSAEFIFGVVMIFLVLETTRRVVGWFLAVMVVVTLAYALGGQYLPGMWAHRGYDLTRLVGALYLGSSGIYGLPMEISATFVIMFVIFGALLTHSGGERWFMDLGLVLTGRFRGGPALSAVASNALMGMISGSPVANVMTVGTFTVPLMRKAGFKDWFSGATVAVASTASMFTPPIMGAGAFLIAEFLQVPYRDVAMAAILPAALFYIALIATVYVRAVHMGIKVDRSIPLPSMRDTIGRFGHMIPPMVALVWLIYMGRSLMQAAFWSIVLTLACSLLRAHTRIGLRKFIASLEEGARGVIAIAVACAAAGIIVGVINLTGVGFTLSAFLTEMAHGQPLVLLLVIMTASLLLGCAIPPTAVYIVLAGLSVPAMIQAGFEPMAAHFFVFFFSSMGAITPPVALAAYAAAAVSGADVTRTGLAAFRLGFVGYIIPFLCMYYSGLLMIGSPLQIAVAMLVSTGIVLAAALGIYFLNAAWVRRFPPAADRAAPAAAEDMGTVL
jgi:TRAP transporter 4TM/12TM fusion protein